MNLLTGAGTFRAAPEPGYAEHLRASGLSAGTYSLAAGSTDTQEPHTEDEVYVVLSGVGQLWSPTRTVTVTAGSVAFVPAGEQHRFVNITQDLAVLVIFGPPEYSNGPDADHEATREC